MTESVMLSCMINTKECRDITTAHFASCSLGPKQKFAFFFEKKALAYEKVKLNKGPI